MKLSELFERLEHVYLAHRHIRGDLTQVQRQYKWGITIPGDFLVHDNELDSLDGAPENVLGTFDCEKNKLTFLDGSPLSIGKSFICRKNQITSLESGPKYVRGDYDASDNKITNLKGIDETLGTLKGKFILSGNPIVANISGIIRIKGIKEVVFTGSSNKKANEAFSIINSLIKKMNESLMEEEDARYKICIQEFKKRGLEEFI